MFYLAPLLGFFLAVVINTVVARFKLLPMSTLMSFFIIGSAIGMALIAYTFAYNGLVIESIAAISFYGLLCVLAMLSLSLVMASVSVFMVLMIRERPRTGVEVDALYSRQKMLAARLDRIESAGLISKIGIGEYEVSPRGHALLNALMTMRRLFGHE
jgi:hypothetical protein